MCLPIQRKVLNYLTWVIVSWISSSVFWSLQVYRRHFPKREIRSKIWTYETAYGEHWELWWTRPEWSFWWSRMVTALFSHKTMEWTLTVRNRTEPMLTPCCNCFFDLLFVAIVIIIERNRLPQKTLPFCLTVNVPFLSSQGDELTLPSYEKKKLTHTFQRLAHPDMFCKIEDLFYFASSVSLALYSAFWL